MRRHNTFRHYISDLIPPLALQVTDPPDLRSGAGAETVENESDCVALALDVFMRVG
jgi:hypothetical protein